MVDDIPVVYLDGVMQVESKELTIESKSIDAVISLLSSKVSRIDGRDLMRIRERLGDVSPFNRVTFGVTMCNTGRGSSLEVAFLRKEA